jgi:hypothetical protein
VKGEKLMKNLRLNDNFSYKLSHHSQDKILIPKLSYPEIACQKTIQNGRKKRKKLKLVRKIMDAGKRFS